MTDDQALAALLHDAFSELNARQQSPQFPMLVARRLIAAGVRVAPSPTEREAAKEAAYAERMARITGAIEAATPDVAPSPTEDEEDAADLAAAIERYKDVPSEAFADFAPSPDAPGPLTWQDIADALSTVRRDPDYAAMNHGDEARAILAALPPRDAGLDVVIAQIESFAEPKGTEDPTYLRGKQQGIALAVDALRAALSDTEGDNDD